jgi:hypothetical protein
MSRVRLFISRLDPPVEGNLILLSVGEMQIVAATIDAQAERSCRVELTGDLGHFEIASGASAVDLGPGRHRETIEWRLLAVAAGNDLTIDVVATADNLRQQATLLARVYPMPITED